MAFLLWSSRLSLLGGTLIREFASGIALVLTSAMPDPLSHGSVEALGILNSRAWLD